MFGAETVSPWLYVLLVVAWFAFGYWGATIAVKKQYNFWLGFVVGFLGGILGIIVLYIIHPNKNSLAPPPSRDRKGYDPAPTGVKGAPRRTKVCNMCGNLVEGKEQYCPYCSERV
jgi:hypothetical protein